MTTTLNRTNTVLKYNLQDFNSIILKGFDYTVPNEILEKISSIAMQVGSPDYVKTPVFVKSENQIKNETAISKEQSTKFNPKKKKGNKAMEIMDDEDWNSIRTFQTTKVEPKSCLENDFDSIRVYINKITEKTYIDMRNKIVEVIEKLSQTHSPNELIQISFNIFDIASSNRYYSKIYAELYSDLSSKFTFIKLAYQENLLRFTNLFNVIEYVDPTENYDRFCEINKTNEKRKSLASFYMNLMLNGIISKTEITQIMRDLLSNVYNFISQENKKNEVDELTETVVILYNKELYNHNNDYELIDGYTINDIVKKIAKSKVKDYKSLTNKSLFKFMDLIED